MKSRIFSSERMKATVKEQIWILGFLMLGFLLAFPVALLVKLGNWQELKYTGEQLAVLYENLWRDGLVMLGAIVAVIAAVMNGLQGFLYLYSGKKVDFYHGLPMRRINLYAERVMTGLLCYLIPYLLMEFLAVCLGAAKGFFSLKLMGMAVQMLVLHLVMYLTAYFGIVLLICITGNLLMGVLCILGVVFYSYALELLLACYADSFFRTFGNVNHPPYGLFGFLESYVSPIGLFGNLIGAYAEGSGTKLIIAVVILGIVLAVLSYAAYSRRPSESAGKSMVYNWVAVIVKYIVVIPFALGIGWIFYPMVVGGKMQLFWWVFGLLLGTILGHGLVEVIYHMSFRGFFAKKVQLVLAGLAVAVCAWGCQNDILKFDQYLPKQEDLVSVNVDLSSIDYEMNSTYVKQIGDAEQYEIIESYKWYLPEMALVGNDGIGDETYQALKNIVENNYDYKEVSDIYIYPINMKYTLKSGRSVYRYYWMDEDMLRSLVKGLYNEEKLKEQKYSFCKLDESYLTGMNLTDASDTTYEIFQNDLEEQKTLIEALKKDIASASTDDLMTDTGVQLGLNYELPGGFDVDRMTPGEQAKYYVYGYWNIAVPSTFKNTLAILEKTGYPLSVNELDINKIELSYYKNEAASESETVTYEDEEDIKELRKALVYNSYGPLHASGETYSEINVVAYTEQGTWINMKVLKDKAPDFVKDKIKELGF